MPAPQEITIRVTYKITNDRTPYTAKEIQDMLNDAVCVSRFVVEEVED